MYPICDYAHNVNDERADRALAPWARGRRVARAPLITHM